MNILALETSMGACGVAVLRADSDARAFFAREERMARGHAEALMPMLEATMQEAKLDFASLDRIAATLGPGSFTGVRIAIAAARALALVTPAKLWGTDSLTVMARDALAADLGGAGGPIAVAVDARREQLYFGLYSENGKRLVGPNLLAPEAAAGLLPADLKFVVGSGGERLAEAALGRGRRVEARLPELEPSAVTLAALAAEADETLPNLHPLYLRSPDAKPQNAAGRGSAVMTTTISVRRAGPLDANALAALHAGSFARAWDPASMAQFLAAPSCLCLIASNAPDGSAQGFLIARAAAEEAELLTLAVDPPHRRRGLAEALLGEVARALRAAGVKQMFLEVEHGNDPALRLYESFGVTRVGERKGYYEHGADASIFCLAL